MSVSTINSRQPFVLAYAWGAIEDCRQLPDFAKQSAVRVVEKLTAGQVVGGQLAPMTDRELTGVLRVDLSGGGALLYQLHPAPATGHQFATARILAAGRDDQELRQRTIQRLRPLQGAEWSTAFSAQFLGADLTEIRKQPELYAALQAAIKTVTGPNPPRSHDPLTSDRDVYLNQNRATAQTVREVPFDTPDRLAAGEKAGWSLTFRTLQNAPGSSNKTVHVVAALPAAANQTHARYEVPNRLQLGRYIDPVTRANNMVALADIAKKARREADEASKKTAREKRAAEREGRQTGHGTEDPKPSRSAAAQAQSTTATTGPRPQQQAQPTPANVNHSAQKQQRGRTR